MIDKKEFLSTTIISKHYDLNQFDQSPLRRVLTKLKTIFSNESSN
jgi:hypothetical protein